MTSIFQIQTISKKMFFTIILTTFSNFSIMIILTFFFKKFELTTMNVLKKSSFLTMFELLLLMRLTILLSLLLLSSLLLLLSLSLLLRFRLLRLLRLSLSLRFRRSIKRFFFEFEMKNFAMIFIVIIFIAMNTIKNNFDNDFVIEI